MTLYCQFCRRDVGRRRVDGGLEMDVPVIPYQGKQYCVPCWGKLREVARRVSGQL